MVLKKGQTNSGSFKKGCIPWHKGNRKYDKKCLYCNSKIDTSDKRTKFCNHTCSLNYRWDGNTNKPIIKEEYLLIRVNGKYKRIHRLVYEKEVGKIPAGYIIHHINGDKLDNRIENLELMSISEHAKLHHKLRRGE